MNPTVLFNCLFFEYMKGLRELQLKSKGNYIFKTLEIKWKFQSVKQSIYSSIE